MDLSYSKEDELFREEARTWLHANIPSEERPEDGIEIRQFDLAWQATQYKGGWAGIAWPKKYGGRGLSLMQQMIWQEEYALAGAPRIGSGFVGINHAGPTLILEGRDEHKAYHLPKILAGEVIWCQGFSEPNSGSDLASIKCSAVIEGDELVVNGQKIWTSYAQFADWQELLVRTSKGERKHFGLSWVVCDMKSSGIEVRPIKCMNGTWHFCEVFYNDVRIPLKNVVGEIGDGWRVAMSTLSFERGTAFIGDQVELAQNIEHLMELAHKLPRSDGPGKAIEDEAIAQRLTEVRSEVLALKSMTYVTLSRTQRNGKPGPEGSMIRLYLSRLQQDVFGLAMDILGPEALDASGKYRRWVERYLWFYSVTISGGSSEIQQDIIGERLLGLPRSR